MITAQLGLDWSPFARGIKQATDSVGQLGKPSAGKGFLGDFASGFGMGGGMEAFRGVLEGVRGAARGMWDALDEAGKLDDLSAQTGLAAQSLSVLRTAFHLAGMAADDVQPVVNKMQRAIADAAAGNAGAQKTFQGLGLSVSALINMDAEAQLMAIGDAVREIDNPTKQAAAAMEVFGKSGGRLLSLFALGGFDEARQFVGKQAEVLGRNATLFAKTQDILEGTTLKLRGLFVGMADQLVPAAQGFLAAFEKVDLVEMGQEFGRAIVDSSKDFVAVMTDFLAGFGAKFAKLKEAGQLQADIGKFEEMKQQANMLPMFSEERKKAFAAAEQFGQQTGVGALSWWERFKGQSGILGTLGAMFEPAPPTEPAPGPVLGPPAPSAARKPGGDQSFLPSAIVGELGRVGGGGGIFGADNGSALLDVNRQQVTLLQRIADSLQASSIARAPMGGVTPTLEMYA
jgi:hypothetical protein